MQSATDDIGSALIGTPVYIESHVQEHASQLQILWISERAPNEAVYAVRGTFSSSGQFPTTVQEATKTPYLLATSY